MRKRRLGRTGLMVSELTFGGGWVGGLLIREVDAVRLAALQRAVAAGIDWIDTAPSYGDGVSEEVIGRLLPQLSPQPRVSTKVRLDCDRLDDLAGQIERSLEASLTRLSLPRVELLQLHNRIGLVSEGTTIGVDHILRKGGVADIFDRLRATGLIDFHGITALGETPALKQVIGSGRFDTAQVYLNLLNPTAAMEQAPAGWAAHDLAGLLAACRAADMGVMVIRTLAAGVLASDARHGREGAITDGAELAREEARARAVLAGLGERHGSRAGTAIRFGLSPADVSTVVVGLAEPAHLEEAIAAATAGPLPLEALAELGELWAGPYARL